jgi:hypothetical protein
MFVLTMLFFPVFYLIQTVIVLAVFGFSSWFVALSYLVTLPLSAAIAWKWKGLFQKCTVDLRKIKFYKTKAFASSVQTLNNIFQKTSKITGAKIAFEK